MADASRFDIKFDEEKASVSEKMETFDFMTRTGTWQMMLDRQMLPDDVTIEMILTLSERATRPRSVSTLSRSASRKTSSISL